MHYLCQFFLLLYNSLWQIKPHFGPVFCTYKFPLSCRCLCLLSQHMVNICIIFAGNCWFLAAVASLCATANASHGRNKYLLTRLVPEDNSFVKDYAGTMSHTSLCHKCFLFIYLGFYVTFNTVQVISQWVVARAEETSTYSPLGFCTVNCRPTASNYQLSHLRPCQESNPVGGESVTTLSQVNLSYNYTCSRVCHTWYFV